jgi:hypothetical protein
MEKLMPDTLMPSLTPSAIAGWRAPRRTNISVDPPRPSVLVSGRSLDDIDHAFFELLHLSRLPANPRNEVAKSETVERFLNALASIEDESNEPAGETMRLVEHARPLNLLVVKKNGKKWRERDREIIRLAFVEQLTASKILPQIRSTPEWATMKKGKPINRKAIQAVIDREKRRRQQVQGQV